MLLNDLRYISCLQLVLQLYLNKISYYSTFSPKNKLQSSKFIYKKDKIVTKIEFHPNTIHMHIHRILYGHNTKAPLIHLCIKQFLSSIHQDNIFIKQDNIFHYPPQQMYTKYLTKTKDSLLYHAQFHSSIGIFTLICKHFLMKTHFLFKWHEPWQ